MSNFLEKNSKLQNIIFIVHTCKTKMSSKVTAKKYIVTERICICYFTFSKINE